MRVLLCVLCMWCSVVSCKRDDPAPLASEVNGVLLAGQKGQSKTWKIVKITEQYETGPKQGTLIDSCILDNIFKFSNDDLQTYESTDGATACLSTGVDLVESGFWAFSSTGKTVIILSDHIVTTNPGALFSFYGYGLPSEVVELSETSFKIKMKYIKQQGVASVTRYYYLDFEKM